MDLESLGSLGWREGLIAIIALLVGYIVLLFVRLRRLQHERNAVAAHAARSAVASYTAVQEPAAASLPTAPATDTPAVATVLPSTPTPLTVSEAEQAWHEPPVASPSQALIESLQQELYQLRCEVDELRAEVLAAREDVRHQLSQSIDAPPPPSPQYNDAMQMAKQGYDATAIAHQCNISRAEADLVVALARNRGESIAERRRGE